MTLSRLHTFCVAAVFTCLLPAAPAQAPSEQPVVLHSSTRLVQISVVVHDRKGQPVPDLKKEEFSLTEKGTPQNISVFSVQSTAKRATIAPTLPPHNFTNRIEDRSDIPSSVTVILLDSLNTKVEDQMYARARLVTFLQQLQPEDRVAIYSLGRSLRVLHDFSTDSSALLARLAKYRGQNLDIAWGESGEMVDAEMFGTSRVAADFYLTERAVNTLKALEAIAEHLAGLPGRKNLIWVSGGFPLQIGLDEMPIVTGPAKAQRSFTREMEHAIRALTNANIAMYPVDARAVTVPGFTRADVRLFERLGKSVIPSVTNIDTMDELASRTGGRIAYDGSDLKVAIRRAIDDAQITYTIGYYPTAEEADGKFREIKIKVDRPGVNVRYRKGYFAMRPVQQDATTRRDQINGAVWSPLEATGVALKARVDLRDKPAPNTVYVALRVDPANIRLVQTNDRWVGQLDVILAQKDAEGRLVGSGITDTLDLNFTKESYLKLLKGSLTYSRKFPREAKAIDLRIVVRDSGTGSVGSIKVPFSQVEN